MSNINYIRHLMKIESLLAEWTSSAHGSSENRPAEPNTGAMYFDSTLGKPIWFDGDNWVDASGNTV